MAFYRRHWGRVRRTGLMPSRLRSRQPLDEECRLGVGGSGTRAGDPVRSQHEFRLVYLEYSTWPTSERGGGWHCTGIPHPTHNALSLTAGFPPSADLGSTSLLFILSGSERIKLEPHGPRATRRPPHLPQWPLQRKSWPMSRRPPPAQPASSPTRNTSTQRVTRPSTEVSMPDRFARPAPVHSAHMLITLSPDFHDLPRRCCRNWSHHRIRNSARPVSLPTHPISFTSIQTPLLQRWSPRSLAWLQLYRVYLLPRHGFSRRNVCLHSTQTRLRRLCHPFRGPCRRIRPWI